MARWMVSVAVLSLFGCEAITPAVWHGIERAAATCDGGPFSVKVSCVYAGHLYACIRDVNEAVVWQCATVGGPAPTEVP